MLTVQVFLAVCLLAGAVTAVPYQDRSSDSCATQCSGSKDKFRYQPGTTYSYSYVVNTQTQLPNSPDGTSAKLKIGARADIEAGKDCEFTLFLRDVRMAQSAPYTKSMLSAAREEELQTALESSALRFSFDDGVISQVCPDPQENTWALNFKKGLLSAFQNSMQDFDRETQRLVEVDVSGQCPVEYNMTKAWSWAQDVTIKKSKDVLACSGRSSLRSLLQTVPYKVPSEIQSLPIVQSQQSCESRINSANVLESTLCTETHSVVPFTQQTQSGIQTVLTQSLKFDTQSARTSGSTVNVQRRQSLVFVDDQSKMTSDRRTVEEKLKAICQQTKLDIRPETPRLFSELVSSLQGLDFQDVQYLYSQLKEERICPNNQRAIQFFRDTLPMAGTPGSLQMMVQLLQDKAVDGVLAQAWIAALAFVQDVSVDTIRAVKPLLEGPYQEEAKLPVSSLVSSFCRQEPQCQSDYEVREVVNRLSQPISSRCYVTDKNRDSVLASLRALGNIRELSLTRSLDSCLTSRSAPLEVKVAAADAYRRAACPETYSKDEALWDVLQDSSADQEVRVVSYLSIMRCPSERTLQDIARYLKDIREEQLGAFIFSHLNNLKETSDPHKQELAKSIKKLELQPIDLNSIKHSRNYEASFIINKLNLGATLDSDVIMSPNGLVPRSAKLNITMDLFGQAVNLLEVGGRVEGLETIIHKVLGYKLPMVKESEMAALEDARASLYARVFGNEILYQRVQATDQLLGRENIPNYLSILQSLAKGQSHAYTLSEKVLDATLVLPTVAGIPLELQLNGSANLDLQAKGKVDLLKLSSRASMDIEGEILPSAAMEITASMSLDALVSRVGLRMRNTMHSSTEVKARVHMNKGRVLDVEIEAPKDKMEIFQAKSEFFVNHNGVEKEVDFISERKDIISKCTGDMAAKITGAELCVKVDPTSLSVMLNKRDKQTSYKLMAKQIMNKNRVSTQFHLNTLGSKVNRLISADVTVTYGSETSLDIQLVSPWKRAHINSGLVLTTELVSLTGSSRLDDTDQYGFVMEVKKSKDPKTKQLTYSPFVKVTKPDMTFNLLSGQVEVMPGKKVEANLAVQDLEQTPYNLKGLLVNVKKEKRLRLELSQSGKLRYLVNVGTDLEWTKKDKNLDLTPELVLRVAGKEIISVSGKSSFRFYSMSSGTVTVKVASTKPGSITWKLTNKDLKGKSNQQADLKVKSSLFSGSLRGTSTLAKSQISSRVKGSYSVPGLKHKNTFTWNSKLSDKSVKKFNKYSIQSSLKNMKYPEYDVVVDGSVSHKGVYSSADMNLKYGINKKLNTVAMTGKLKHDLRGKRVNLALQSSFKVPAKKIDLGLNAKHSCKFSTMDSSLKLRLSPFLKDEVDLDLSVSDKSGKTKMMNYNGQAKLQVGDEAYSLSSQLSQKSKVQYIHFIKATLPSGGEYKLSTIYKTSGNDYLVVSTINRTNASPILLTGRASLQPNSQIIVGELRHKQQLYRIQGQSKLFKKNQRRWNLELEHPDRNVELTANAKQAEGRYEGDISFNWDAQKKLRRNSEVKLHGSMNTQSSDVLQKISFDLDLKTPFKPCKELSSSIKYVNDPGHYNVNNKLSWGGKSQQIVSNLIVAKPLTLANINVKLNALSPLKQFRQIDLSIQHTLDTNLNTIVKGQVDGQSGQLKVQGQNRGSSYNRDLSGTVELVSPFKSVKTLVLTVEHKGNAKSCQSKASLSHNGNNYHADANMNTETSGSFLKHTGQLILKSPEDNFQSSWTHQHSGVQQINSDLTAKWGRNQRLDIALSGKNEPTWTGRDVTGELTIKSPYRHYREVIVKLDHSHSADQLNSQTSVLTNRRKHMAYDIKVEKTEATKSVKVMILPHPEFQEMTGELSVSHSRYPHTLSAWLQWSPSQRIELDGSLNILALSDMDMSGKLTTPFRSLRSVTLTGSHRYEQGEYISHANLGYGIRQTLDMETRYRNDDRVKLLRAKLDTPFDQLKSLDSGLRLDMRGDNIEGKADVAILPLIGKYDGFVDMTFEGQDVSGKLHLNTPDQGAYLTVIAQSKEGYELTRSSFIQMEQRTLGVYKLDSTYRTVRPYKLDVGLKTPYPDFDDVGFQIDVKPSDQQFELETVIIYLPRRQIETKLESKWDRALEGKLVVKSPLRDFRYNKIVLRHQGSPSDFSSHGEVQIGGDKASCDLSFFSNTAKTVGTIKLDGSLLADTPLDGSVSIRGPLHRLSGHVQVSLGGDKVQSDISHVITSQSVRSSFTLSSPYTRDVLVTLNSEPRPSRHGQVQDSSFEARLGEDSVNCALKTILRGINYINVDATLKTPFEKLRNLQMILEHSLNEDDLRGKAAVRSSLDALKDLSLTYSKLGPLRNMKVQAQIASSRQTLLDTHMETTHREGELHGKLVSGGQWLPSASLSVDHENDEHSFKSSVRANSLDKFILDGQLSAGFEAQKVHMSTRVSYKLGAEDHTHKLSLEKAGDLQDFTITVSKVNDGQEVKATTSIKTENGIQGSAEISNLFFEGDVRKISFEHSGDLDKFLTSASISQNDQDLYSGKIDFYHYGLKRVELTTTVTTPFDNYRLTQLEYRHESQKSGRSSCNFNFVYGKSQRLGMEFVVNTQSSKSININVQTPFRQLESFSLSADVDQKKTEARLSLQENGQEDVVTLNGQHDVTDGAVAIDYVLNVPRGESTVRLSLHGSPLDHTAQLALEKTGRRADKLTTQLKYDNFFSMDFLMTIESNCINRPIQFVVKNTDDVINGKKTHVELDECLHIDGTYLLKTDSWSDEKTYSADLELSSPRFGDYINGKKYVSTIELTEGHEEEKINLVFTRDQKVLMDVDVKHSKSPKEKFHIDFREPHPMEYSFSLENRQLGGQAFEQSTELYFNFDKDRSDKNFRLQGTVRDSSSSEYIDHSSSLSLAKTDRTYRLEHTVLTTDKQLSSEGKFSWSEEDDSQVFYQVEFNKDYRGHGRFVDGLVKLGVPTRTFGVVGSASDDTVTKKAQAAFSWDMDRDEDRKIGISASLSGRDYSKADIELTLPAEFKVSSALILNQGDLVLDGKADISYSKDSRKTLTLFSKIKKNQPDQGYFATRREGFNYSMELGLSHPESRLDLTLASHLGQSPDLLTSSVGLDYLTSRRQVVNFALTAEIDQLRNQINLRASGPSDSVYGVQGRVVKESPLSLELTTTVEGEQSFRSTLDLDEDKLDISAGDSDQQLVFRAFSRDRSAVQADLTLEQNGQRQSQEALVVVQIPEPKLLSLSVDWKPQLASEAQQWLIDSIQTSSQRIKDDLRQLTTSIETELTEKHRDISQSLSDQSKPILQYLRSEKASLDRDVKRLMTTMEDMRQRNEFFLADLYELIGDLMEYTFSPLISAYRQVISEIRAKLEDINNYDVRQNLGEGLVTLVNDVIQKLDQLTSAMTDWLEEAGLEGSILREHYNQLVVSLQDLYQHNLHQVLNSFQSTLREKLQPINDLDLQPYIAYIPEYFKRRVGEIYHQVKSVSTFWVDKDAVQSKLTHAQSVLHSLLQEEAQKYTKTVQVKVFDLDNGKIRVDIQLPVEVDSVEELLELPDHLTTWLNSYKEKATEAVSQVWSSNKTSDDRSDVIVHTLKNLRMKESMRQRLRRELDRGQHKQIL